MNILNKLSEHFVKNFTDWFDLKPKIDANNSKPPLVEEGNIWWVFLGENIGTESVARVKNLLVPVLFTKNFLAIRLW
jgi:hypothetical protein